MKTKSFTPVEAANSVRAFCEEGARYLYISTRYGNHYLPVDEMWKDDETRSIHISVRLPEGYDLIKLP